MTCRPPEGDRVCDGESHGAAEGPAWTRLVFSTVGPPEGDELDGNHPQRHIRSIRASMLRAWARIVCGAQDDSKVLREEPVHLFDLQERRQQIPRNSTSASTSPAPRTVHLLRERFRELGLDEVEWSDGPDNISMKICDPDGQHGSASPSIIDAH